MFFLSLSIPETTICQDPFEYVEGVGCLYLKVDEGFEFDDVKIFCQSLGAKIIDISKIDFPEVLRNWSLSYQSPRKSF